MTKDEALQMCLEYIETDAHERRHVRWAIKDALTQTQEPLGYIASMAVNDMQNGIYGETLVYYRDGGGSVPIYITPPQRTWVGLTDEEYKELHLQIGPVYYYQEYGQAIEAKLKEKNT